MSKHFLEKTALIVDDEPILTMELSLALQDRGCANVVISKTPAGAESLIAHTARIDLAILELAVRGESSLPLAQRLMRDGARIVLTSSLSEQMTRLQAGATLPIIQKPYVVDDVLALLAIEAPV